MHEVSSSWVLFLKIFP